MAWSTLYKVYEWDSGKHLGDAQTVAKAKRLAQAASKEAVVLFRDANPSEDWDHLWAYSRDEDNPFEPTPEQALKQLASQGKKYLKRLPVAQLEVLVKLANRLYTNQGSSPLTDIQYDELRDRLKKLYPASSALAEVGAHPEGGSLGKTKLPYYMGSLDKVGLDKFTKPGPYLVSAKMDGISLLYVNTGGTHRLYTRGDGYVGQDVTPLIKTLKLPPLPLECAVRMEAIMDVPTFQRLYSKTFRNPRNMMAGMLNRKTGAHAVLQNATVLAFEMLHPRVKPSMQFAKLQQLGFQVPRHQLLKTLDRASLLKLLIDWKRDSKYEMDGLVVTSDYKYPVNTGGYPSYSFAFKDNSAGDGTVSATVLSIEWNISRHGQVKPTALLKPVQLNGVTISRATAFNAKFVKDNSLGKGAVVTLQRSGDVIPDIVKVIKPGQVNWPAMEYEWDRTKVNIVTTTKKHPDIHTEQLTFALQELGVENIGRANAAKLVNAGITNYAKLLKTKKSELVKLLGQALGNRLQAEVETALSNASLLTLMVSSGAFGMGFGHRKLKLALDAYPKLIEMQPSTISELEPPHGLSRTSMKLIATGIKEFNKLMKKLGKHVELDLVHRKPKAISAKLAGVSVVFTGFRDAELEQQIVSNGGTIASSVKKGVTYLVMKRLDSGSSKAQAARTLGVKTLERHAFEQWLQKQLNK